MYVVEDHGTPCHESKCIGPAHREDVSEAPYQQLNVIVRRREIQLCPGMQVPVTRSWPASKTFMKLERLVIQLFVDIAWMPYGHHEFVILNLTPQIGARATVGGSPKDAERWAPLMISGEQTVSVVEPEASSACPEHGPPANVLHTMCRHSWEEEPAGEEDQHPDEMDAIGGTVEDIGSDVSGGSIWCVGFAVRAQINVTVSLYVSPAPLSAIGDKAKAGGIKRQHTLLVSGVGTLEMRPRLVELRRLGLTRLLAAAAEDTTRGENVEALHKWRHVLAVLERKATKGGSRERTNLASLLHSMGVAYNMLGDARDALACLRRALAIRQHVYGEEHPESAKTLQALGVVRVRDGEYHEAFEYLWQALKYYEAFEPESLDAASTLHSMAGVFGKFGEYSEALECYVRALPLREQGLGRDHLEVAATLHNMGVVFEKLSDHSEALDSLHRALAIREQKLGLSHPHTARTLHSVGIVYSKIFDYLSALKFYQRALTICQKTPEEEIHAAATLNNMGVVYAKLGRMELAMRHHQEALAIQDKVLGPKHGDTTATRYNLHVLQTEMERMSNRPAFDSLKEFLTIAFLTESETPSLLVLLCEESGETDGPLDEPFCSLQCGKEQICSLACRAALQVPYGAGHLQDKLAAARTSMDTTCDVSCADSERRATCEDWNIIRASHNG